MAGLRALLLTAGRIAHRRWRAAAAGVAAATGTGWQALAGGAALGAVYLALRLASPSSLGGGDLKAAPAVGAATSMTPCSRA